MENDMSVICRGTTPRVECTFQEDLSCYDLYFSMGPNYRKAWFTVPPNRITCETDSESTRAVFTLEQRETLLCSSGPAFAQFRIIDENGDARASDIIKIQIVDIVKDGVIKHV